MALDRDVAQALDLDAEHRQDRGDPPGPEERAMLAVGSVIHSPGALDGTPNEHSVSEFGEALQQRGHDRGWPAAAGLHVRLQLADRERPLEVGAGLRLDDEMLRGLRALFAPTQ